MAALAGIGFTISIFVAGLAFGDPDLTDQAKIGVLAASTPVGTIGAVILTAGSRPAGSHGRDDNPTPGGRMTHPLVLPKRRADPETGRVPDWAQASWSQRGHGSISTPHHETERNDQASERSPCSDHLGDTERHPTSPARREFESPPPDQRSRMSGRVPAASSLSGVAWLSSRGYSRYRAG